MARRRYQWPSSRLTGEVMARLHAHQQRTGRRITVTVQEAVVAYLAAHEAPIVIEPKAPAKANEDKA